jgi:hypothetical protein
MPSLQLDTVARLAIVRAMLTQESITVVALPDSAMWLRVFNHAGHVGVDLIHQEQDFFDTGVMDVSMAVLEDLKNHRDWE